MKVEKHYCDKCKNEFKVGELFSLKIVDCRNYDKQKIDLCTTCAGKIGITEEKKPDLVQKSTAEQLYDIIADIVYENLGE